MDKVVLRRQLLKQRQNLSDDRWQSMSKVLSSNLSQLPIFQEAITLLSYFSFRREPDISSLFSLPKRWGFSRCAGDELIWHRWGLGEPLENNNYGIPEPLISAEIIAPTDVDLMLIPAVACDERGYRLGYGGGYFDRLLSSPEWAHIPTIGIVFDFAYLPEVPIDPWDTRVKSICTESGVVMI